MNWSDIIEINSMFANKLTKIANYDIIKWCSKNSFNGDIFATLRKCLDLMTTTVTDLKKCIIVRYIGWLSSINSDLICDPKCKLAEVLLTKWIEFYEILRVDMALKWIEYLTGYTYRNPIIRSNNSYYNNLINWELVESDVDSETSNYFWSRSNIEQLDTERNDNLGYLIDQSNSENLNVRKIAMGLLKTSISLTYDIKLLYIGNNTCLIQLDGYDPYYLDNYSQLVEYYPPLTCNHYYQPYLNHDKYDYSKHWCPVCGQFIDQGLIEGLTPDQLSNYEYCAKCHHFRDPTLFVDNICDYCTSIIELYRQLNIVNCPNCGLEIIISGKCCRISCCIYGCFCEGELCDHGSTNNIIFCGYRWG